MFSTLQRHITNGNVGYLKQLVIEEFYLVLPSDMKSGFNLCHPEQCSILLQLV